MDIFILLVLILIVIVTMKSAYSFMMKKLTNTTPDSKSKTEDS